MGFITLFYLRNDFANEILKENPEKIVEYLCSEASSLGHAKPLNCHNAINAIGQIDCCAYS